MTTHTSFYRREQQISSVRLARSSNLAGTYYNGSLNNGVGATLTVAASSLTVDSVVCAVNDRVLLFAQTNTFENGIYRVDSIGSTVVLKRAVDFQEFDQMKPGYYVPVAAGTEFHGAIFGVIEPQVQRVGTDGILFSNAAATPDSFTLSNTGLQIYNPAGTFLTTVVPTTAITANRQLSVETGDADRTLDISAGSVTVSAYGATLVDDATKLAALTTLGVKRATTAAYGGGGTSNAFVATGLAATDIVVANILASTNSVSITKAVPTADTLTITFSADPGAATTVNWIAIATV